MTEQRLFSNQRLIRLIIPLVIEQALTILVGMCDGVMVSSVGEAAISGVSLVDMINNVILVLFAYLLANHWIRSLSARVFSIFSGRASSSVTRCSY